MNKLKNVYLEEIKKLKIEEELETIILSFLENYTEEDNEFFDLFMLSYISILKEHKIYKIKSAGYDKIRLINKNFNVNIENLKKEYKEQSESEVGEFFIDEVPPKNPEDSTKDTV